eukprot:TRINITY_DN15993_c0_g1_i6.p1 TRINITY_DN15993_c0_g1~~TRINITY_DN15993_c0_g1_i6.p1  ORF type:complete len:195 (-),score=17.75 TRINITY_DN15993_c0_g1_i6:415-999(-)
MFSVAHTTETAFVFEEERQEVTGTGQYAAKFALGHVQPWWVSLASSAFEVERHSVAPRAERLAYMSEISRLSVLSPPPHSVPMPEFSSKEGDGAQRAPDEEVDAPASSSADNVAPNFNEAMQPSVGSALHASGRCLPCRFYKQADGCIKGAHCNYCHHAHADWSRSKTVKYFRKHIHEYQAYYYGLTEPTPQFQ